MCRGKTFPGRMIDVREPWKRRTRPGERFERPGSPFPAHMTEGSAQEMRSERRGNASPGHMTEGSSRANVFPGRLKRVFRAGIEIRGTRTSIMCPGNAFPRHMTRIPAREERFSARRTGIPRREKRTSGRGTRVLRGRTSIPALDLRSAWREDRFSRDEKRFPGDQERSARAGIRAPPRHERTCARCRRLGRRRKRFPAADVRRQARGCERLADLDPPAHRGRHPARSSARVQRTANTRSPGSVLIALYAARTVILPVGLPGSLALAT
jgi:hypothetical protein